MEIYLDHNVIDDISKGVLYVNDSSQLTWIYSNENFNEIKRAGDRRFLQVLGDLKARKIELILNDRFQITGQARLHEFVDPEIMYDHWLDTIGEVQVDEQTNLEIMGRLFGADNNGSILFYPDRYRNQIASLLEPYGLYDEQTKTIVDETASELKEFVSGPLQLLGELEKTREALCTHKGRASNLAVHVNPIEEIWKLIRPNFVSLTADQFFGFDPLDTQGYQEWPLYLGIVGCHTVLNFLGYKPDKGLSKVSDLPGILSDASHIGMAAYCSAVLSHDKKLCSKARAIYTYKNIDTQVFELKAGTG